MIYLCCQTLACMSKRKFLSIMRKKRMKKKQIFNLYNFKKKKILFWKGNIPKVEWQVVFPFSNPCDILFTVTNESPQFKALMGWRLEAGEVWQVGQFHGLNWATVFARVRIGWAQNQPIRIICMAQPVKYWAGWMGLGHFCQPYPYLIFSYPYLIKIERLFPIDPQLKEQWR